MAQMRSQTENVTVNRQVFASMAQELGIQFEFITNRDHDVLQNMEIRDPDVAYLFEPSTTKIRMRANDGFSTCDANFFMEGRESRDNLGILHKSVDTQITGGLKERMLCLSGESTLAVPL